MSRDIQLGCGLLAIGRQWGTTPEVPSELEALHFLVTAYTSGVRIFDTAPSYGLSEERLGLFLGQLTADERRELIIATKFGEHWDSNTNTAYTDHSLDALMRSLDQSISRLGNITILQLHKTTPELLASVDVAEAFSYAEELGITRCGVSISDQASAQLAVADTAIDVIQLPYNSESTQFQPIIRAASAASKFVLTNRPFQMGHALVATDESHVAIEAFRFVLSEDFDGAILTGTSNITHLQENIAYFRQAQELIRQESSRE